MTDTPEIKPITREELLAALGTVGVAPWQIANVLRMWADEDEAPCG